MSAQKTQTPLYTNARARIQRLKDAKIISGWVLDLSNESMRLRQTSEAPMETGDIFMVQVHGQDATLSFKATLAMTFGQELTFVVHPPINRYAPTENARQTVVGMTGNLKVDGLTTSIEIVDISQTGIGFRSEAMVSKGAKANLNIDTPTGELITSGEIRYCRPDPEALGSFRVGVRLDEMGRLERARWARLFEID